MATSSNSQTNSPALQTGPLLEAGIQADPAVTSESVAAVEVAKEAQTPKRGRKSSGGSVEWDVMENPSWLPDKWETKCKTRTSGATAGIVDRIEDARSTAGVLDRYYFDPTSQTRFRSKKEVDYFLKHGTKRKKSDGTPDVVQPSESPAVGKKKSASGSKSRRPTLPPNFNFDDIPESTIWKLSDPENDVWTTYVDDKPVKKAVKAEWDAVFKFLSSGNERPM